jgi:hypothetical protein
VSVLDVPVDAHLSGERSVDTFVKGLDMSMTASFGYFETGQRDFVSEITMLLAERPARDITLAYDVVRAVLEARESDSHRGPAPSERMDGAWPRCGELGN